MKDFLLNSGLEYTHASISNALIKFADAGLLKELGDATLHLIDDCLTDGNEDSLSRTGIPKDPRPQRLPQIRETRKSEEFSPHLRTCNADGVN